MPDERIVARAFSRDPYEDVTPCGGASKGIVEERVTTEPVWKVRRHGGRRTDFWRTTFTGTEEAARRWYRVDYERMRQGGVQLVQPDGAIVECAEAPRLRTQW
jgi:hypothetical protein